MNFQVTQADIDLAFAAKKGKDYVSSHDCPAGQALQRILGHRDIWIGAAFVKIGSELYKTSDKLYQETILPFEVKKKEHQLQPGDHTLEPTVCLYGMSVAAPTTEPARPAADQQKLEAVYARFDITLGTDKQKSVVLMKFTGQRQFHCIGEDKLSQTEFKRLERLANENVYLMLC